MAEWLTPITDRTEADTVEAFNNQMIEAHLKGALNYSDLNRIENNFKYLVDNLAKQGYYINHKYRNYTEREAVVTEIEIPGKPGSGGNIVEPWLQSSGTQYIDTGFKPNNNTRVVVDAQFVGVSSMNRLLVPFGCRSSRYFELYKASSNDWNLTFLYNTSFTQSFTGSASIYNQRHTYEINKNVATFNGATKSYTASTFQMDYNMYIFGTNNTGTLENPFPMKLYSAKIYDNGTLVRDFTPKLDDNGVACLYDKVEGKYYYNAGTGIFTYGENVYSPVEYLRGTGAQYINTNFIPTNNTKLEAKVDTANGHFFSGVAGGNGRCGIYALTNGNIDVGFGTGYFGGVATGVTYPATITLQNGNLIVNDKNYSFTSQSAFTAPSTLSLFAEGSDTASGSLYYYKIYQNDNLVRDFIPVIDSSGTALLYDQLNGVPYYNAGTGSFVAGAVIPPTPPTDPTIEYIVEYVQNTYTEWFEQNLPWKSEFDRIRRNFNNLLKEYLYGKRISQVPYTQYFKFTEANKLEDISALTKQTLENMIAEYFHCGTVNSGGDRLL